MESADRRAGLLLPLTAGGIAAGATIWVVANIWASCDVGGGANGGILLFCFLPTWWAFSSLWSMIFRVLAGKSAAWAFAVAFCISVVLSWGLIAWIGILDSYPAPICPGNIPE
ncbi:hypothetical protein ACWCPF_41250 [Streptomyces sp. NPDC001858]